MTLGTFHLLVDLNEVPGPAGKGGRERPAYYADCDACYEYTIG